MENNQNAVLENEGIQSNLIRRRKLLPFWMKAFIWIFMAVGCLIPFVLLIGILDGTASLSIYGIETIIPFSGKGIAITILFAIKSLAAFGLWLEKDWAIKAGIFDAVLGIVLCLSLSFIFPTIIESDGSTIKFRFEIILLIIFLNKLIKIKPQWESCAPGTLVDPDNNN